ncbi:hypothetical protein AB0K80_25915 [Streptomyces sp. NPDC052682]|uniref:Rv1733c family protein n=1 Tax=Streptomyces sp. NPDC052682 TaxID=3154954 RepID=UPI00344790DC
MGGSRSACVRWWRWRRNPLRRRSDLIEAWIVLAGWVLALLGGLAAALLTADAVQRAADRQRAGSHPVTAVVVERAKDGVPAGEGTDSRVWATVRWTAPDGSKRTDDARVAPRAATGTTVTVWTDGQGQVTAEPMTEGEARWNAVAGGVLAALGVSVLSVGTVSAARLGLERRRMAQWDAEWERIDRRWGRTTG